MTDDELDKIIVDEAKPTWRKVAMIVAKAGERVGRHTDDVRDSALLDRIAGRIVALVGAGKLAAQGDLSKWRHSEIKRARPDCRRWASFGDGRTKRAQHD